MRRIHSKPSIGKAPCVCQSTNLVVCALCVAQVLPTIADGQMSFASRNASQAQPQGLSVDEGQFNLRQPTREDDTPGLLKYGGYAEQPVTVRESTYRGESGEATVEVVKHPLSYPYAKHDFLGAFLYAYQEQKNKKSKDAGEIVVPSEYVNWQIVEPPTSHTICVLNISTNGAYHGIAGWYSESGEGVTTVMLRFGASGGLPRAVIDRFLHEYPSSIRGPAPSLETWEADDILKWISLLQTRATEDVILSVGRIHLRRYDRGDFGLREAWNKRSDPAALTHAVNDSVEQMRGWLAEREKTRRKGPQP